MPGLVGIIGQNQNGQNRKDLSEMVRSMQHELFYKSGTYVNEAAGLYVGWTCHRGSYSDCMPITDERKELALFFYGEHFADREEYDSLRVKGYAPRNQDASFVLGLFADKGYDFLKCLNGWFHGVLVDLERSQITLFNDRYGMQRLYYYEDGDSLLFASEAKAILKVRRGLRALDPRSVGEFLSCDCILENRTLFSRLHTLPGGSVWTFKNAKLQTKGVYFKPQDWESQSLLGSDDLGRDLEGLLPRVMMRYFQSTLPIAVSLTGGVDTRMIMAYIDNSCSRISCYTFGGMYRDSFDVKLAQQVAAACGKNHAVLRLGKDFLTSFPSFAEKTVYLSDGCLSAGSAYELYLNRLARQVAEVRLTGSYGSEVFRGSRGIKAIHPNNKLIHPDFHRYIEEAIDNFEELSKCHNLSFSVFRQAPWLGYGRLAVEQSQVVVRTPFMDNDLVALLYRAPESVRSSTQLQRRLTERANPTLLAISTDRGLRGRSSPIWAYFTSYFLYKADYLYKSGMPQWMEEIHYLLGPFQPERLIIGRHRFSHLRIWFRNELASYLKDFLLDPLTATRPYVNGSFVQTMVLRHIKGDRNYTSEIEKVLTMELVYRLFIET